MSFIYTIYKRFKRSGISDVLVAADGSVDQALRGMHSHRGVRCLRLFYDTLVHHASDKRVEGSPLSEEVQASLFKLRHLIDPQELADAHAELEQKAQVKDLVDSLFNDFDGAPQAEYWISFMEIVEIHATGLRLDLHSDLCFLGCKSVTTTNRVGIFQTFAQ